MEEYRLLTRVVLRNKNQNNNQNKTTKTKQPIENNQNKNIKTNQQKKITIFFIKITITDFLVNFLHKCVPLLHTFVREKHVYWQNC